MAQRAGNFFFRGTGLPTVMRKNQPLVPRSNFGAQEPTPGSAVEHCRFLDTGGGGVTIFVIFDLRRTQVEVSCFTRTTYSSVFRGGAAHMSRMRAHLYVQGVFVHFLGLKVNYSKTDVVVKSSDPEAAPPKEIVGIMVKPHVKYLGVRGAGGSICPTHRQNNVPGPAPWPRCHWACKKKHICLHLGQLEIIARVAGPPTSCRAELQGAAIVCYLACQGDELVIDNQAVVEYWWVPPHRECSDSNLRKVIKVHQAEKRLRLQWIPFHRTIKHYHTAQENRDIECNDAVDKLAKTATQLPLRESPEGGVDSIMICNGVAPTPAKKWIMEYRHEATWGGTHWMSRLPLKGTQRVTWITWLWGNVRWQGIGPPWEKGQAKCPPCG